MARSSNRLTPRLGKVHWVLGYNQQTPTAHFRWTACGRKIQAYPSTDPRVVTCRVCLCHPDYKAAMVVRMLRAR